MKALFYLLCVLNLSVLLWELREGRFESATVEQVPAASILTVEEFARAKRGAEINARIQQHIKRWQQTETERMLADLRGKIGNCTPCQLKINPNHKLSK